MGMALKELIYIAWFIAFVAILDNTSAAPINSATNEIPNSIPETNVTVSNLDWLQRFGYFVRPDPRVGTLMSESSIATAIRELQRFAGLPETGVIDAETAKLMKKDRCGVPDFGPMDKTKKRRKRRFTLHGTFWKKTDLTWRLNNENNDGLQVDLVETILENAFAKWAAVTNLKFFKAPDREADIMVSFHRGYHRDPYPFDGRDGVLAHAFYPHDNKGLSGDVHFDDDEEFTYNSVSGRNLFWVAVHEIGHSLGLQHSNVKEAIMFPYYQSFGGKDFELTKDDITGIQHLYGAPKVTTVHPPTESPVVTDSVTTPHPPIVCIDRVGAVFLGNDKKTYVINHDKLYILRAGQLGIEKGPVVVGEFFEGVSHVDAAYRRPVDGKTVLFSGKKVYVFDDDKKISGPRDITKMFEGFPAHISKIDAAFVWPGNGRTYMFAGEYYWRYDDVSQKVDYGYPRKIATAWGGVPANIESAFTWSNGVTYFFKGTQYYRLRKTTPVKVDYGYPKSIQENWMRCKNDFKSSSRGAGGHTVASLSLGMSSLLLSAAIFTLLF